MKPILVVMAAGMGSRYGGLKQIDKLGPNGEIILELSVYDAIRAGFEKVIFILRKEIVELFKEIIGNRLSQFMEVEYVIQDLNDIPKEFEVPEGREKPWGTAHAILSCKNIVKSPFVVINADDFYGRQSFELMYDFLSNNTNETKHSMIGYKLCNTLSEYGHVARGICEVKEDSLIKVIERTKIIKKHEKAFFTEDEINWYELDYDGIVSMNLWGFMPSIFKEIESEFKIFLKEEVRENPLKSELYIPNVVGKILMAKTAKVKVINTKDKWYGVTYQDDKLVVKSAIGKMIDDGIYPKNLWGDQYRWEMKI